MSFLMLSDWMELRVGEGILTKAFIYAIAAVMVAIDVALAGIFVYAVRVI